MGSSQKISLTVLGLFSLLFIAIIVVWGLTQADDAQGLEVLSAVDKHVDEQSPFNTGIIPPFVPSDAGTELPGSQDCSYEVDQMRDFCEFQLENLREFHAQDLQDILAQIEQNSGYIRSLTLDLYDLNKNGRITCDEAKEAGIAPVTNRRPAYQFMRDTNQDGVVCES